MNRQRLRKKIWICGDVWMDILPSFDHTQLGLKIALLSYRYDAFVDKHFDGKKELTIWRTIKISDGIGPEPKLSGQSCRSLIDDKWVEFPLPDRPLPDKIRFKHLQIPYIDHSVIEFLHANQQIFDKGTNLTFEYLPSLCNTAEGQAIWDLLIREIWLVFAPNIRHLCNVFADFLDTLCRINSPTILTDLNQLNSIEINNLFPDVIGDDFDGPNAIPTAGQNLFKWLHIPSKNGQPKRLHCCCNCSSETMDWVNNFKEKFLCATTSVSYKIQFVIDISTPIEPFELVNGRTNEKLTLEKGNKPDGWGCIQLTMKRCPIGETAAVQWEDEKRKDMNNVSFPL